MIARTVLERLGIMTGVIALLAGAFLLSCAHVTPPGATHPLRRGSVQDLAHGYWQVTAGVQEAGVAWIAMQASDLGTMTLVWPTDLGCTSETAKIAGRRVSAVGDSFPAVVTILSSRTAVLSFRNSHAEHRLRKTRRDPRMTCE